MPGSSGPASIASAIADPRLRTGRSRRNRRDPGWNGSMPLPSSGGVVLVESLNILEGFPMGEMKQGSAPSLHLLIEAMKRAYADRARYLGDPAFVNAPADILISKDYAAKQRAGIDLARATPAEWSMPSAIS